MCEPLTYTLVTVVVGGVYYYVTEEQKKDIESLQKDISEAKNQATRFILERDQFIDEVKKLNSDILFAKKDKDTFDEQEHRYKLEKKKHELKVRNDYIDTLILNLKSRELELIESLFKEDAQKIWDTVAINLGIQKHIDFLNSQIDQNENDFPKAIGLVHNTLQHQEDLLNNIELIVKSQSSFLGILAQDKEKDKARAIRNIGLYWKNRLQQNAISNTSRPHFSFSEVASYVQGHERQKGISRDFIEKTLLPQYIFLLSEFDLVFEALKIHSFSEFYKLKDVYSFIGLTLEATENVLNGNQNANSADIIKKIKEFKKKIQKSSSPYNDFHKKLLTILGDIRAVHSRIQSSLYKDWDSDFIKYVDLFIRKTLHEREQLVDSIHQALSPFEIHRSKNNFFATLDNLAKKIENDLYNASFSEKYHDPHSSKEESSRQITTAYYKSYLGYWKAEVVGSLKAAVVSLDSYKNVNDRYQLLYAAQEFYKFFQKFDKRIVESRLNSQDKFILQRHFRLGSLKTFVLFIKSYVAPAFEADRSQFQKSETISLNLNPNVLTLKSQEFVEWAESLQDHSLVEFDNVVEVIESIEKVKFFDEGYL